MKLHNLILETCKHKFELLNKLVINVLCFRVTDDYDAFLGVVKDVFKNRLGFYNIINIML